MTNTKETSSNEALMKHQKRDMQFLKFGAKTTGIWQPCDLVEGLKAMRAASKRTIATIDDAALQRNVEQRLTQLNNQGRFVLNGCKLVEAMVDCIATAPRIKRDAYVLRTTRMLL
jgi:hypothetical protein